MEIEPENISEPDIRPDRSVLYFGLAMGSIILVMALLSIFMEDIRRAFNPPPSSSGSIIQTEPVQNVENEHQTDEEEIKKSIIKFIEAFYVDQRKGYFDPPSYFSPLTQTYYNYHNLTYQGLRQVHHARMADLKNLELNWLVHTLTIEHRNDTLIATFWTKQNFFKPSKNAQESADILMELQINKEGKICSLKELEIRNLVSIKQTNPVEPQIRQPAKIRDSSPLPENKINSSAEIPVYNSGLLDFPPEFKGGNKKLKKYLSRNLNYPQKAKEQQVEGKVFLSFIVEPNGDLTQMRVIKGIGSGCDEEALRVLRNSPPWRPGMLDEKAVRSSYVLPIVFKLAD